MIESLWEHSESTNNLFVIDIKCYSSRSSGNSRSIQNPDGRDLVEILISQNVRHYKIQQHTKILPTLTVLDESTADISVEDAYLPKCPSLLEQKILSSNVIETRIDDHNIIRSVLTSLCWGSKHLNATDLKLSHRPWIGCTRTGTGVHCICFQCISI